MRLEDLPPALRAQVDAQLGKPAKTRTTRRGDSLAGVVGWCRCGLRFEGRGAFKAWEAHSVESGHRRFEIIRNEGDAPTLFDAPADRPVVPVAGSEEVA